jgi:hypothetical protein
MLPPVSIADKNDGGGPFSFSLLGLPKRPKNRSLGMGGQHEYVLYAPVSQHRAGVSPLGSRPLPTPSPHGHQEARYICGKRPSTQRRSFFTQLRTGSVLCCGLRTASRCDKRTDHLERASCRGPKRIRPFCFTRSENFGITSTPSVKIGSLSLQQADSRSTDGLVVGLAPCHGPESAAHGYSPKE